MTQLAGLRNFPKIMQEMRLNALIFQKVQRKNLT